MQKFEICGQSIFKVIEVFNTVRTVLYIGCSGPMIRCSCTQSSGLDKRELYAMSRIVHAIFELAHVFWDTCCIFDHRKPRQACADSH